MTWRILRKHQRLRCQTAAGPDRSEIGPYLGSLRATSRGVTINSALPGHLRGKAISPKAPRPQTWTTAEPDRRRAGQLGDRSLPRKSSDYIHGRNTGSYHSLSQHDRSHSKSFRLRLARGGGNLKATAANPRAMVCPCVRPCGGLKSWRYFWRSLYHPDSRATRRPRRRACRS